MIQQGPPLFKSEENIDVACLIGFVPGNGTENTKVVSAVFSRDGKDLIALFSKKSLKIHAPIPPHTGNNHVCKKSLRGPQIMHCIIWGAL